MKFIAEIGINHNGDLELAKKMIYEAKQIGCQLVKFQKRTIDKVYTQDFLSSYRESPWGTTQRMQKEGLEFGKRQYDIIDAYCKELGICWTASAWDMDSQLFLRQYNLKYNKIASAMLSNIALLEAVAQENRHTFISTGMSTFEEIETACRIFKLHNCKFELLHCVSVYPMPIEKANLKKIAELRGKFGCDVGYSGHECDDGLVSLVAIALGATTIERHVTMDRTMYGSDQKASITFQEYAKIISQAQAIIGMLGSGGYELLEEEVAIKRKLRGN